MFTLFPVHNAARDLASLHIVTAEPTKKFSTSVPLLRNGDTDMLYSALAFSAYV